MLKYPQKITLVNIDRVSSLCINVIRKMDGVFETYACLGQDAGVLPEPDDIPKTTEPVWILGKHYNAIQELETIRRDVQSRLWCTYRRGFVPIGSPQLTSDKGWGCMLRCGQMVLGQALIDLHLGRDWFWTSATRDPTYLKIVSRFEDNRRSPFSIHQIALMGDSEDKKVGEWFGPNTVAQVLRKLVKYDDWCSIVIHVALDNAVVTDQIVNLCQDGNDSWKPLLLIIPLRLGLSEINPIYIDGLKKCFEIPGTVGMIGGRPNRALYFIGYVGDEALYLDPHTTQRSGSIGDKSAESEIEMDETFHQKYAARISFIDMDPSLALCFLCKTKAEFTELCSRFQSDISDAGIQPLFEIVKTGHAPWLSKLSNDENASAGCTEDFDQLTKTADSDEEFEFIT
ncbi:Cysteine protease ATG4B [Pseudolycoriella hygida]|uniref:Cysteine protease n=1 Tax=Pseudolycoriella hygida TaxID=35572 RepID=A0A9Q0NDP7_9DIPT|nr:Cysteine protease ATG4B [Pseudolycoriella hygida]